MLGMEVILACFSRGSTFFEDLQGRLAFQRLRIHVGVAQDEQTDDLHRTKETGLGGRLSAVPLAHLTVRWFYTLGCRLMQARCSGVRLSRSISLTLALWLISRRQTTSCPTAAARCSGVWPVAETSKIKKSKWLENHAMRLRASRARHGTIGPFHVGR